MSSSNKCSITNYSFEFRGDDLPPALEEAFSSGFFERRRNRSKNEATASTVLPKITAKSFADRYNDFVRKWKHYKIANDLLDTAEASFQLLNCCDKVLRRKLREVHSEHLFSKTEDEILQSIGEIMIEESMQSLNVKSKIEEEIVQSSRPILRFSENAGKVKMDTEGQSSGLQQKPKEIQLNNPSFAYKMNYSSRGYFVIFNYKNFHSDLNEEQEVREGTDEDRCNLEKMAKNLGFVVETHNNLKMEATKNVLEEVAKRDHQSHDCFACAILTHGGEDDSLFAFDKKMYVKDFTEPFEPQTCKSLAGKPKMFFIQACRGEKADEGVERPGVDRRDTIPSNQSLKKKIPRKADFLIAYATAKDHIAWRNTKEGSWFIKELCLAVNEYHPEMHLLEMLTVVNHQVSLKYETQGMEPGSYRKKQIPSIMSQLTRFVYFSPKRTPDDEDSYSGTKVYQPQNDVSETRVE